MIVGGLHVLQTLQKSILLLFFAIVICCGIYPLALWVVGQTIFPFQANGSIVYDSHAKPIGSLLIAQPFTKDEYFQPRPSAASYNAAASSSSALAASNYALRSRVANSLGSIVKYESGPKAGQLVAPDIKNWFQQAGQPHLRAQSTPFDLWRQAHPDIALQNVPGDMVTTSGSGLDPHITLQNALYQLDRVASAWASQLKRDPNQVKNEIGKILDEKASAPLGGLAGEKIINVLEVNLELHKQYGAS